MSSTTEELVGIPDITDNSYIGLVDGVSTRLGEADIAKFDAGTITGGIVNGESYGTMKGLTSDTGGFFSNADWSMQGLGGTLLGAGQLAIGALSYFDQSKTADAQRHVLAQEARANDYNYNKTVADNQHVIDVFKA